uniref:Ankyrin repeat domain 46b n=1 Tax=Oncorhynchus mykiss TaxID=8022 RepID=A0A8C7U7N2_ONCMY
MEWPAQSPDLNPIELLWEQLDRLVRKTCPSSQSNLWEACIDGDLPFAKRLLETGCDPNIRDNRGRTGLHLAAARGNVDICWFLHKFGADLLATDYQGNTALHLCGHVDTIQFLVSNGLKIDICAMESHSLLNPNLQNSEGVLSSFRTTWQEFVEDLGFWRVLLLLVVIALLSLGIAYYVSGVLPFSASQLELVH